MHNRHDQKRHNRARTRARNCRGKTPAVLGGGGFRGAERRPEDLTCIERCRRTRRRSHTQHLVSSPQRPMCWGWMDDGRTDRRTDGQIIPFPDEETDMQRS